MDLIVTHKNHALHGETGSRAIAAARSFFEASGVAPEDAATASWEIEGALELDDDYQVDDEACRLAEIWSEAPKAVAKVIGLPAYELDVILLEAR